MRNLGFALVLVSLVFTTGGVAVVGRADTSTAPQQSVAPAQSVLPPAKKLPDQCGTPTAMKATPSPKLNRSSRKAAFPSGAIPLNTRGYNYGAQELPAPPPAAPAKP
jgi:hypothetical protein